MTVFISCLLQACSVFYFGHTKEEWNKLSATEKSKVKEEYQAIIQTRTDQAHDDKVNGRTQSIMDYGASKVDKPK